MPLCPYAPLPRPSVARATVRRQICHVMHTIFGFTRLGFNRLGFNTNSLGFNHFGLGSKVVDLFFEIIPMFVATDFARRRYVAQIYANSGANLRDETIPKKNGLNLQVLILLRFARLVTSFPVRAVPCLGSSKCFLS